MDCSLPSSSVHGIFQAIVLEWIAISFSKGSSQPRDQTRVSLIVDRRFIVRATREVHRKMIYLQAVDQVRKSGQKTRNQQSQGLELASQCVQHITCPTLCDPMNRSTPGLPVHHQLPGFTQTHVHRVSDAIQPSHPLSSPCPPAPNPSQHQSLFQ